MTLEHQFVAIFFLDDKRSPFAQVWQMGMTI